MVIEQGLSEAVEKKLAPGDLCTVARAGYGWTNWKKDVSNFYNPGDSFVFLGETMMKNIIAPFSVALTRHGIVVFFSDRLRPL